MSAEANRRSTLRRIAIVLQSLPPSTSQRLLGSLGKNETREVNRVLQTLVDVDPLEKQRALRQFASSIRRASNADPEIIHERVHLPSASHGSTMPDNDADAKSDMPMAFLESVDNAQLVSILSVESAHTIAIVLANINPNKAAAVLPELPAPLRSAAMSRLSTLGEIPIEAIQTLSEHFQNSVKRAPTQAQRSRQALQAILAAMTNSSSQNQTEGSPESMAAAEQAALQRSAEHAASVHPSPSSQADSGNGERNINDQFLSTSYSVAAGRRSKDPSAEQAAQLAADQAIAHMNASERSTVRLAAHTLDGSVEGSGNGPVIEIASLSTSQAHSLLLGLPPAGLCRALGSVDTRTAVLALCGLPGNVVDAALSKLGKQNAMAVRRQMFNAGTMNLREIDQAKTDVARASLAPPQATAA